MIKQVITGSFKDMVQPDLSEMSLQEYDYLSRSEATIKVETNLIFRGIVKWYNSKIKLIC